MTRSDEILYTGVSAAAERKSLREQQAEEHLKQKSELIKDAKVVFQEIEKHKKSLGEKLLELTDENSDDNTVRLNLAAIRLHRQWVTELENKLRIVLRAKEPRQVRERNDE